MITWAGMPFLLRTGRALRETCRPTLLIPDILEGDPTLSFVATMRTNPGALCEPIFEARAAERVPPGTYPAGATHPAAGTD